MRLLGLLENRPLKIRCKSDQEQIIRGLSGHDLDMLVDLRPFMQRNPFIVHADASLSRAYRLFRTMGLRHMFVCQPQPKVRRHTPSLHSHGASCTVDLYMELSLRVGRPAHAATERCAWNVLVWSASAGYPDGT